MKRNEPRETPSGQFAFDGLDRVLHEKARLGILSSLVANPQGLAFSELKDLCDLTDGNLNRHMQVLEEARLVEIEKGHRGKRPQTVIRLTEQGRVRFLKYIGLLEQIVEQTLKSAEREKTSKAARRVDPGLSPG